MKIEKLGAKETKAEKSGGERKRGSSGGIKASREKYQHQMVYGVVIGKARASPWRGLSISMASALAARNIKAESYHLQYVRSGET